MHAWFSRSRGCSGLGWEAKYCGEPTIAAQVLGHAHGHHVLLDELADLDAGVEAAGDEVDAAVVGGHVENDFRVVVREPRELWDERDHRGASGQQQPHASRRPVAEARHLVDRLVDVVERRLQPGEELLTRVGPCHAAGGAREQPHPHALLQAPDGVAQGRRGDPEALRGPGEAALLRHRHEGRQSAARRDPLLNGTHKGIAISPYNARVRGRYVV